MKTYNIILKGIDQIEFPRIVSRAAQALIKRLCREVPAERLGYQRGGIDDIKKHRSPFLFFSHFFVQLNWFRDSIGHISFSRRRWFQVFDWDGLTNRTLVAPIVPVVSSSLLVSCDAI